jgi:PKD repeat protein
MRRRLVAFCLVSVILVATFGLPINVVHAQVQNVSISKLIDESYYKETLFVITTEENTYHIIVRACIREIGNEVLIDLNATLLNPHNNSITASAQIPDILNDAPYYSGTVEAFLLHLESWVVTALKIALPVVIVVALVIQIYYIIESYIAAPLLGTLKTLLFGGPFIWASLPWVLLTLLQDTNANGSFDLFVPYWPPWPHIDLVLNEHYFVATSLNWWEILKKEVYTEIWTPWGPYRIVWFTYFEARWVRSRIPQPPPNIPPTASFYWTPSQPIAGEEVAFVSTSFDSDGFVTSNHWWLGDGNQKTDASFTHIYITAGNYSVILEVTDNDGLTSAVNHTVNVQSTVVAKLRAVPDRLDINVPKGQYASATFIVGESLNQSDLHEVTFAASDLTKSADHYSISSGNVTFSKNWITIGKGSYTDVTVTFQAPMDSEVGWYSGNITVGSQNGGNATIFANLYVFGSPYANFSYIPKVPTVGEIVTFDGSLSIPSGWTIIDYKWSFGDGGVATGKTATHAFSSQGVFTVTLNVTDSKGMWDIEQKQIEVKAPPPPLAVSISPTSASILVGQSVTFTSTVSGGYTPYSYQWYLNGAPVLGANATTWTFTPTTSGIYYVHLKVTDAKGNTAQSETARITAATVPVGGYSIPIKTPLTAKPITPYYVLLTAILTIALTAIKRKTTRKRKRAP